jgi:hypothetical protein
MAADHCALLRKLIKSADNGVDADEVAEMASDTVSALENAGFEDEAEGVRDAADDYESIDASVVTSKLRTILSGIVANDEDEEDEPEEEE